jgi:hypothetical protein
MISFNKYDNHGNLTEQQKVNDVTYSYVYDYDNSLGIAEVTNAAYSQIAYTSFEADGSGNWSFNSNGISGPGITGSRSFQLSSTNTIARSGLTIGKRYIVSCWAKNGTPSISGGTITKEISGKTINGWAYHEYEINVSGTVTVSGTCLIDELRLYPSDAYMTTYTYDPLIGVTCQSDLNCRITYFIFDSLGRLSLVKDEDGNILKEITYAYKEAQ